MSERGRRGEVRAVATLHRLPRSGSEMGAQAAIGLDTEVTGASHPGNLQHKGDLCLHNQATRPE